MECFFIWGKGIEKGRGEGNDWPLGTVVAGEMGEREEEGEEETERGVEKWELGKAHLLKEI